MTLKKIIGLTIILMSAVLSTASAETAAVTGALASGSGVLMPGRVTTTTAAIPAGEAKATDRSYLRPYDVQRISIFAFAGTKCPADSLPYKGIQAKHAEGTGAIYCIMKVDNVYPFMKAFVKDGKCPQPLVPYLDQKYKPDDDAIWCQFPADGGKAYDLSERH